MNPQQPIVAVLLAAGAGARFGGDKLLHPLDDGASIAAHAARNLRAADLEIVAVIRPGDFPLSDVLEQEGCEVTQCPDAVRGMGYSLAHGVANAREAGGWIIALADMPRVRPSTIRSIAEALAEGATIVAPRYRGTRGHPVGFAAALRNELVGLTGDTGARAVVERYRDAVRILECDDPGIVLDVDAPSDLKRLTSNGD